jgi:hypothetical protein
MEAPVGALVHKTTYAPMIYTALYVMCLMRADPLLGQMGGGWARKPYSYSVPNPHRLFKNSSTVLRASIG